MADKKTKRANGEGSIFFDEKNNRWRCQISYKLPNGVSKRKSFSGKNKTEVRNKKNKFIREITLGKVTDNSKVTIVELLRESAEYDRSINSIGDATYCRRLYTISIIEDSCIGDIPITTINESQINQLLLDIKSRYSNSVIRKVYSMISQGFKIAIHKRLLSYNLMDSPFIKKPQADREDTKITAFTVEEQTAFLKALDGKKQYINTADYKPMYLIELFAGLRMGEICALTPNDIDLEHNIIRVTNSVTRGVDYEPMVGTTTKTHNGVRDVPIQPILLPTLEDAISKYKANRHNLLFYNFKSDRPIVTQQTNSAFKRLCEKAQITISGGQHLLRHTFATRAIEAGVPAAVLKKWMGHSDISITLNTYCDVFDRMNDKAMDCFSDYLKSNL